MSVCCVRGCPSRYVYCKDPNPIRFHNLPQGLRNEQRRRMWEHNIGKKLTAKSVVCEKHFTPDQYEQNRADGKRPLRWNAVPTIFPFKKPKGDFSEFRSPKQNRAMDNPSIKASLPATVPTFQIVSSYTITTEPAPKSKSETASVFTPILPKIEPNLQNAVAIIPIQTMLENDKITKEMLRYQEDIKIANKKLKMAGEKIKTLEKQLSKVDVTLKSVFNNDQLRFMGSCKGDDFVWSEDTLEKATDLYLVCGSDGYRVILSHNLPYPPLEILEQLKPELFAGK